MHYYFIGSEKFCPEINFPRFLSTGPWPLKLLMSDTMQGGTMIHTGGYEQFSSERVEYINLTRFVLNCTIDICQTTYFIWYNSLKIVSLIININS